ncbi:MAG: prepilin-type N-terminal cleavage/methylation domain-containing protein, partial [Verrucomicrobiae bacterium]|nr:prepilin-type N-terminal cleavage/methylation domain-containing protein [Verrucomicrobiae bacterium]
MIPPRNPTRRTARSFTLMELLMVIAIMALLLSIGAVSFLNINKGANIRAARDTVKSDLKLAQQSAIVNRQRVGFFVVTAVYNTNNPYVTKNMENRAYFLYAVDTPGVAKQENFLSSIQVLPAGTMFDDLSTLPTGTFNGYPTGGALFEARRVLFDAAGTIFFSDSQNAPSDHLFKVSIREATVTAG